MTDDGDTAGGDTPDDSDVAESDTPDDSDAAGSDTPGDAAGSDTPGDAAGDDTPDDATGDDPLFGVDPDRFVGYGIVYAGVLFLLMGLRAGPTTLDLATVYFLATGVLFVGGGLYRLANPVEGGSISDSDADQVTIAVILALALLTGVFLLSLL